jgi:hypothetical protein
MGLDVWFPPDVARILASVGQGGQETVAAMVMADPDAARLYQAGHAAALRSVALAFGVSAPQNDQARGEWISARPIAEAGYKIREVLPD